MELKFTSIVLSKSDINETDRLYIFYTREKGKVIMPATGVKKPHSKLAASLEPLTLAEIFASKTRGRGRITGAITVNNFTCLKKNLPSLERIFFALNIFSRLIPEEEKDENIFNLLQEYLEIMNLAVEPPSEKKALDEVKLDILTYGFIFRLLHLLGYGIETKKCLKCAAKILPGENYFFAELGGVVCKKCFNNGAKNNIKISNDSVKLIRLFLENKLKNLVKIKIEKKKISNLKFVADIFVKWIAS